MDKDAKALTVVPCGRRPSMAVTTATGDAMAAMTEGPRVFRTGV
ncbi:hypothetical protein GCM10023080_078010 [Streptomyces pseudoechinosporeus]